MAHWLCIRLPRLALEVFTRASDGQRPLALVDGGRKLSVLACNGAARRCGVRVGMSAAAARALSPELLLCRRNIAAEEAALCALADWAGQFSSRISLHAGTVLLENEGSLKLFGGRAALLRRVRRGVAGLGYRDRCAAAPTPLSAVALSRCRTSRIVEACSQLPGVLGPLPLSLFEWDPLLLERLQGMGLRSLDEVLRLPRDGLARRFGVSLLRYLDRLLGRVPHPLPPYRPPLRFVRRLSLPGGVSRTTALMFVLRRLVHELCGWLQGQGAGVASLQVRLWSSAASPAELRVGLRRESRDAGTFLVLLQERLQRLSLPRAVSEIELRAQDPVPLDARPPDLFEPQGKPEPVELPDRLRARLGAAAVRGIAVVADHRPERAWRRCPPGERGVAAIPASRRPLWLLPQPERLRVCNGRPWLQGELQLEADVERIESGWWDGGDIARDYFMAVNPAGSRYWVYRELRGERGWYLHGVFD